MSKPTLEEIVLGLNGAELPRWPKGPGWGACRVLHEGQVR